MHLGAIATWLQHLAYPVVRKALHPQWEPAMLKEYGRALGMAFFVIALLTNNANSAPGCVMAPPGNRSTGIVLLHGKQGMPDSAIGPLAQALRSDGYSVETPEMPWSQHRFLDASLFDAMKEIDLAFSGLRARCAARLVIAGHSLGATVALAYVVRHRDIAGLIMLATGASPDRMNAHMPGIAESVEKARRLVAAGQGGTITEFAEFNKRPLVIRTTPEIYLSYLDPEGPALVPGNAERLTSATPLLFVEGERDPLHRRSTPGWAFERAPYHAKSAYIVLPGGHLDVPSEAIPAVRAWLSHL